MTRAQTQARRPKRESITRQLWPSGQSITYRGNPQGDPARRSIRITREYCLTCHVRAERLYCNHPHETTHRWVRGTEAEWRAIRIAEQAEMYADRYIWCCDSALVDALLKLAGTVAGESADARDIAEAFSVDALENVYADPSNWDAAQCRAYASAQGITLPESVCSRCCREVTRDEAGSWIDATDGDGCVDGVHDGGEDDESRYGWLAEARKACREHAQDNPAEVMEWYRVDPWLCRQLREIGEVVIDNGYGCWFGRQTTGQGLIMDGTLQRIAASFETEVS